MRSHEFSACPTHVRNQYAGRSNHGHFDERTATQGLQSAGEFYLERTVVAARGAHEHAAPDVELYFSRYVRVTRVFANRAVARPQRIARQRLLDHFMRLDHASAFNLK